jgi:hypothetical protein
VVRRAQVSSDRRVDVIEDVDGLRAVVQSVTAPSIPPTQP